MIDFILTALAGMIAYAIYQVHGFDWALIFGLLCVTASVFGWIFGADINHDPYEFIGVQPKDEHEV